MITCPVLFTLLLSLAPASQAEGQYSIVAHSDKLIDIEAVETSDAAFFLAALQVANWTECADTCGRRSTSDDAAVKAEKLCNTAVFFPGQSRAESCFLMHCVVSHCAADVIDSTENVTTYVIDIASQSGETQSSDQSQDSLSDGEAEGSAEDDEVTKEVEHSQEKEDSKQSVDHVPSSQVSSNLYISNVAPQTTPDGESVGTALVVIFFILFFLAAALILLNKVYQSYNKRRLYDKLDYLAAEPLYRSSSS